jgi:GPH family glycoside/pentoside/hexuronide:cation symporter
MSREQKYNSINDCIQPPIHNIRAFGYSTGNFGKNIVANTLAYFLLFYITDILNIAAKTAGVVILVALIFDAILDPLMGFISDRTYNRFGKYGTFILLGAPLCAISFIAIFILPLVSDRPLITLIACLLIFRASYTLIDLPHNALLARISTNSQERAKIASMRFFCSSVGSLGVSLAAFHIFNPKVGANQALMFQQFSVIAAFFSLLSMYLSWFSVRKRDRNATNTLPSIQGQIKGLIIIFRDRQSHVVILAGFFAAMCIPIFAKGLTYFCKYNLEDQNLIAVGLTTTVVSQAISTIFWAFLSQKFNKSTVLIWAHILSAVSMSGFCLTVSSSGLLFIFWCVLIGWGAGGIWSVIWGMVPDVIDNLHLKTGHRSEAVFVSMVVVFMKIAHGIGAGVFAFLLADAGYSANITQSPETLSQIRWSMCFIPVAGALLSIIVLIFYNISHETHRYIAQGLLAKKLK